MAAPQLTVECRGEHIAVQRARKELSFHRIRIRVMHRIGPCQQAADLTGDLPLAHQRAQCQRTAAGPAHIDGCRQARTVQDPAVILARRLILLRIMTQHLIHMPAQIRFRLLCQLPIQQSIRHDAQRTRASRRHVLQLHGRKDIA